MDIIRLEGSGKRADVNTETISPATRAASKVFDIAELLETVLEHVPMKDLLLCQRVSKQFRAMIQSSTRLQRKLYLRHSDDPPEHAIACHNQLVILDQLLNPLLRNKKCSLGSGYCFAKDGCLYPALIGTTYSLADRFHLEIETRHDSVRVTGIHPREYIDPFNAATESPERSWQNMLVHQSSTLPVEAILYSWANSIEGGSYWKRTFPAGSRMGTIMEWMEARYKVWYKK